MYHKIWVCLLALVSSQIVFAQIAPPAELVAPAIVPAQCCTVPALTTVKIEFVTTLNSQANKIGERFPIRLAEPVELDGKIIIPAGVEGYGEIVHAAKSRFGGKAGEMILAVRSFVYQGVTIPLRSLRYAEVDKAGRGKDNGNAAIAMVAAGGAIGGVLSLFITGGEVNIPAGTQAFAKTAAPVTLSPKPD